jgi:hypothetical protein
MIALTDEQLEMILSAAAMVGLDDRRNFLKLVAAKLPRQQPHDDELVDTLVWILQDRGISVSSSRLLKQRITKEKLQCVKPMTKKTKISKTAS